MRLAEDNTKFKVIETMVQRYGLLVLIICRLSPIMPFVIENYIFGITSIKTSHYLIATIAILPGCIFYTILGSTISSLQDIENVERKATTSPVAFTFIIITGILTLLSIILFSIAAKRQYRRIEQEIIHQNEIEVEMQDILPDNNVNELTMPRSNISESDHETETETDTDAETKHENKFTNHS